MNRRAWYILLGLMSLQLLTHSGHLGLGPRGIHVWRQCNTLATAKNFYEEDMDLFRPRVDHRKETNGVTGMAFPFYEYLLAGTYQLTGFANWPHRVLQFLLFQLGCIGLFLLLMKLFKDLRAAAFGTFFYMWSPEMYYYSINALPDISAMTAVIWSSYLYLDDRKRFSTMFAVLLLTLAGLIKLQYLLFGLLFFAHAVYHRRKDDMLGLPWMGLIGAGVAANWYVHSIRLRYENQLHDYGLFLNPVDTMKDGMQVLWQNLIQDLPEQVLGYSSMLLALIGIYLFFRKAKARLRIISFLSILPFILFHLVELKQMIHHAYYMMPYVFVASLLVSYCIHTVRLHRWTLILLIMAGAQVGHAINKIHPRYTARGAGIPVEFQDPQLLKALQDAAGASTHAVIGPDDSGCIYFYYVQVKGWNVFMMDQLEKKDDVRQAIEQEKVDCLVIRRMDEARKKHYSTLFPDVKEVGDFTVMRRSLH